MSLKKKITVYKVKTDKITNTFTTKAKANEAVELLKSFGIDSEFLTATATATIVEDASDDNDAE